MTSSFCSKVRSGFFRSSSSRKVPWSQPVAARAGSTLRFLLLCPRKSALCSFSSLIKCSELGVGYERFEGGVDFSVHKFLPLDV